MGLIKAISPALHSRVHELKHGFKAIAGIPSKHAQLPPVNRVISAADRMDSIARHALLDAHVERAPLAFQASANPFRARLEMDRVLSA